MAPEWAQPWSRDQIRKGNPTLQTLTIDHSNITQSLRERVQQNLHTVWPLSRRGQIHTTNFVILHFYTL